MSSAALHHEELRDFVAGLDVEGLLGLLQDLVADRGRLTASEKGAAFEFIVVRAFELETDEVEWPYRVHPPEPADSLLLEQIDGLLYLPESAFLIESKAEQREVGFEPIAKLKAQISRRPGQVAGAVFSLNGFTLEARTLVLATSPANVVLWEGSELQYAIERQMMIAGMRRKFRDAIKRGFIDYNLQAGAP